MTRLTLEDKEWLIKSMVYLLQAVDPDNKRLVEQQGDRLVQDARRQEHIRRTQESDEEQVKRY